MQRSSPLTQRSIEFGARTVLRKLHALSPMSPQDMALIEQLAGLTPHRPGAELVVEGKGVPTPRLVVNGWAARIRTLPDGRRQILGFVLPGDGIGLCHRGRPLALTTLVAITPMRTLDASPLGRGAGRWTGAEPG